MHLARLVSYGHSYENAEDLYGLLEKFPLEHSFFHLLDPQRNSLPIPSPSNKSGLSNFHHIKYNRGKRAAEARYHSKYSVDTHFNIDKTEGLKRDEEKKRRPRTNTTDSSCKWYLLLYFV